MSQTYEKMIFFSHFWSCINTALYNIEPNMTIPSPFEEHLQVLCHVSQPVCDRFIKAHIIFLLFQDPTCLKPPEYDSLLHTLISIANILRTCIIEDVNESGIKISATETGISLLQLIDCFLNQAGNQV